MGLRVEHSVEADEILRVKQAVEEARHDLSRAIITYHLDKDNINRYNPKTYEEIYHHKPALSHDAAHAGLRLG